MELFTKLLVYVLFGCLKITVNTTGSQQRAAPFRNHSDVD